MIVNKVRCFYGSFCDERSQRNELLDQKFTTCSFELFKDLQKRTALLYLESDELRAVHHLVEAHSPGLRQKTCYRYEKQMETGDAAPIALEKEHLKFDCSTQSAPIGVQRMLDMLKEMPKGNVTQISSTKMQIFMWILYHGWLRT